MNTTINKEVSDEEAIDELFNHPLFKMLEEKFNSWHYDTFGKELKDYDEAFIDFEKEGEKVIITIHYRPRTRSVEIDPEKKQKYISAFSGRITELILLDPQTEEGVAKHREIINNHVIFMNNYYNEQLHHRFYESVEEIQRDYKEFENVKIIVKDDDKEEKFVNIITVKDVERWRLDKFDENDRIWNQFDELMPEDY